MSEKIPMNPGLFEQMKKPDETFRSFLQRIDKTFTTRSEAARALKISRRTYYRAIVDFKISEYK